MIDVQQWKMPETLCMWTLTYDKGATTEQWRKFIIYGIGKIGYLHGKKKKFYFYLISIPFPEIYPK